jgi:hypothetical protein
MENVIPILVPLTIKLDERCTVVLGGRDTPAPEKLRLPAALQLSI